MKYSCVVSVQTTTFPLVLARLSNFVHSDERPTCSFYLSHFILNMHTHIYLFIITGPCTFSFTFFPNITILLLCITLAFCSYSCTPQTFSFTIIIPTTTLREGVPPSRHHHQDTMMMMPSKIPSSAFSKISNFLTCLRIYRRVNAMKKEEDECFSSCKDDVFALVQNSCH